MMIEKKKTYIGTYRDQKTAARAYDKYNILLNGIKAKTNFNYTRLEIKTIQAETSKYL